MGIDAGGGTIEQQLGLSGESDASSGGAGGSSDALESIWAPGGKTPESSDDAVVGTIGGAGGDDEAGEGQTHADATDDTDEQIDDAVDGETGEETEQDGEAPDEVGTALADLRALIDLAGQAPQPPAAGDQQAQGDQSANKLPDLGKIGDIFDQAAIDAINTEAGEPEGSAFGVAVSKAATTAVQRALSNVIPHIQAIGGALAPMLQEHQARQVEQTKQTIEEVYGFFDQLAGAGFDKIIGSGRKVGPAAQKAREDICRDAARIKDLAQSRGQSMTWIKALKNAAALDERFGEKALTLGAAKGSKPAAGGNPNAKPPLNRAAVDRRQAQRSISTNGRGQVRSPRTGGDPKTAALAHWTN